MDRKEEILVPVWFLEHIEDTLRIENNINNDKKTGETCQDRNIKQALNGIRKILSGENLTGNERLEPLKPYNAKKDLTLTWDDMQKIYEIICGIDAELESLPCRLGYQEYWEEVLTRFKRFKEAKK